MSPSATALQALLAVADRGYRKRVEEGLPVSVEAARRHDRGDVLADFIVLEIADAARGSEDPVHQAIEAMQRAREQLDDVIAALGAACDGDGRLR